MHINQDILIQSIEASNLAHTISLIQDDLALTYVNDAFLEQTGYTRDEVVGHNCRFLQGEGTDPDAVVAIRQSIKDAHPIDIEILNYKKDGTPFWNRLRMAPVFDDSKALVAFIGIQSDVTHMREQQRLEEERQKLEALGRMSANISHEIKNAIQPVKLMSETLLDWEMLSKEQLTKCIGIIHDNINIADVVTRDVLRFSKQAENVIEDIAVSVLIPDITSFTKSFLNSRVDFSIEAAEFEDGLSVHINQVQLYQVMMNLINNALHAMNESGDLRLIIEPRVMDSSEAIAHKVKKGKYISISFQDSGCGMDEKLLHSIFDPFFSTKPMGEGTGLGLSISYGLVKSWGGTIIAKSQKDQGSVFSILLPTA